MNIIRDFESVDSGSGVGMYCLSCGSIFAYPIILDDCLGSLIRVCPDCKSADIAILDKSGVKAGKEDHHE